MKIKIKNKEAGVRLDKFLAARLDGQSRGQAQKIIEQGLVTANGRKTSAHYKIKGGDLIQIKKPSAAERKREIKAAEEKKKPPAPEIIEEEKRFLVVNKPSGLIAHGADYIKEKTLIDFILKKFPEIKKIGEDPARPGIVHRLDKEASGLMVIARNQDFFDFLKKQFKERAVKKEYTALAYGRIDQKTGEINFPIGRGKSGGKMAAYPETWKGGKNKKGKKAVTEYETTKEYINYTLLKVRIKTGRTHQIRAHFSALGHPLVGDNLYGNAAAKKKNRKLGLGRVFLVADKLEFSDPAGKKYSFSLELPAELKILLAKIK